MKIKKILEMASRGTHVSITAVADVLLPKAIYDTTPVLNEIGEIQAQILAVLVLNIWLSGSENLILYFLCKKLINKETSNNLF